MTIPSDDITAAIDQEEARLVREKDEAFARAKRKPTNANLADYKKAEKALQQFRKDRQGQQEPGFPNVLKVVEFLEAEGWKIRKSTAYEHVDDGKLRPQADGIFARSDVLAYAVAHLQKKDGSAADGDDLQRQKVAAEVRRIHSDAEMREHKLRKALGEVIEKSEVESQLAERAADLKSYLDNVARASSSRIIKLVGGDPQKAPELISFMLGVNRKAMDNYSRALLAAGDEED